MADEEVGVSAHEHIEPNVLNILIILAVIVIAIYGLQALSHKYPSVFGGLSAL